MRTVYKQAFTVPMTIMRNRLQKILAVTVTIMSLSVQSFGQHGGGGHGGGGHGGGGFGGGGGYGGHSSGGRATVTPSHAAPHAVASHAPAHAAYHGGPHGPVGYAYNHAHYGGWYHGDWHDHWAHPWHCCPVGWVGFGVGFGVGVGVGVAVWDAPWHWGYWPYYNPYYTEVVVVDGCVIDYSRPIVIATPAPAVAIVDPSVLQAEAAQALDTARSAFTHGDYPTALAYVNRAIAKRPSDALPHEFRALVLFATGQYRPAAAAMHAVLSVGPGWDWATLISLYPNPDTYTAQLRALEQYRNAHLDSPDVRFLLAYHYMSCGSNDAAAAELREVVRLSPKDQLSAQLLAGLSGDKTSPTTGLAGVPATPAKPVEAAGLVGNWSASRADGASFSLTLSDKTFAWKYTQDGRTQEYSGTYSVADNLLILKQDGKATMIGQVATVDGNRFNFKLVGDNSSDPGIAFVRR
jgi:hypothetical protein